MNWQQRVSSHYLSSPLPGGSINIVIYIYIYINKPPHHSIRRRCNQRRRTIKKNWRNQCTLQTGERDVAQR